MKRALALLCAAAASLAASATVAQAIEVRGFHAYDAGRHITWKWTVCTPRPVRVQTIIRYARTGSYQWRRGYNTGRYPRGCTRWVSTEPDRFLNGEWLTYIEIGPNRVNRAVSRTYAFYIG